MNFSRSIRIAFRPLLGEASTSRIQAPIRFRPLNASMRLHSSAKVMVEDVKDGKQIATESAEDPKLSDEVTTEAKIVSEADPVSPGSVEELPTMPGQVGLDTELPKETPISAFALPTMTPGEALPESFRASQIASLPGATVQRGTYRPSDTERKTNHKLHVQATRNNCIITLTTHDGSVMKRESSGSIGFKKAARSGYESAYRVGMSMFQHIETNQRSWGIYNIDIIWKGFGQGREAVYRALLSSEGTQVRNLVRRISDNTALKVGGTRPRKRRSEFLSRNTIGFMTALLTLSFCLPKQCCKIPHAHVFISQHFKEESRIKWIPNL